MANLLRQFESGGFYHVYNRGNHRQATFMDDFDHDYFLQLLDRLAGEYEVEVLAYCLMRNHYHLLVRMLAIDSEAIRKMMSKLAMSYANYYNRKYGQVGRLFQGPYRTKPVLTDEYLIHLVRYIHLNPAEFADPLTYRWSSIASYRYRRPLIADPSYVLKLLGKQSYELGEHVPASLPLPAERREAFING